MSRIEGLFARKNPVFIGFTVAGDPGIEASFGVAKTMIDAGVDLLEIAVPYSDPVADGPVIERAHVRALRAGTTPDAVFALVRRIREHAPALPLVLFTYYNIILRRGPERFFAEAAAAGADGVLIVDLPAEESGEVAPYAARYGIYRIVLIAPTTSPERQRTILKDASGFVYLISLEGVTGERDRLPPARRAGRRGAGEDGPPARRRVRALAPGARPDRRRRRGERHHRGKRPRPGDRGARGRRGRDACSPPDGRRRAPARARPRPRT